MLVFACVKVGAKYGAHHVNVLADMITRNCDVPHRIGGVTDDPAGISPNVETSPAPTYLEGWWAKLALFRWSVFEEGDHVVYFDLDTVITGSLKALAEYSGPFAILRDFYRPLGLQSAVMAWEAGTVAIWQDWVRAGMPRLPGGDQEWVEQCVPDAVRLQDKFPGDFVSYKGHCQGRNGFPRGAKVVCFHGEPKPDA